MFRRRCPKCKMFTMRLNVQQVVAIESGMAVAIFHCYLCGDSREFKLTEVEYLELLERTEGR